MFLLFKNLLARGSGDGAWIQILIIAAVVGFGILQKIISSIKSEAQQMPKKDKPIDQITEKYVSHSGEYKTLSELHQEKIAQIRAVFGIPKPASVEEVEPVSIQNSMPVIERSESVYEEPPAAKSRHRHKVHQQQKKPVQPQPVSQTSQSKQSSKKDKQQSETESILVNLNSPQDLRAAILYQEILGPPVSMR